jgi:hypothetical protein
MNDKSIFETEGSMISLLNWPVITGRHKRIKTLTYEKTQPRQQQLLSLASLSTEHRTEVWSYHPHVL